MTPQKVDLDSLQVVEESVEGGLGFVCLGPSMGITCGFVCGLGCIGPSLGYFCG